MARREVKDSFRRIPETCPKADKVYSSVINTVNSILDDASLIRLVEAEVDRLHQENIELREALRRELTDVCEELLISQDRVEELENQVSQLEDEVADWKSQVEEAA